MNTELPNKLRKMALTLTTSPISHALFEAADAIELSGWHRVESAPRDGTPIIGGFHDIRWADSHRKNDIVRCWFQPEFDAFISSCRVMQMASGYTIDGVKEKLHSPVVEPITHWMPLPTFLSPLIDK